MYKNLHLLWNNNKPKVQLHKSPKNCTYSTDINWKNEHRLQLTSDFIPKPFNRTSNYTKKWIPLLKSHLQKTIRRQLHQKAVQTALELITVDHIEFLRRFSIIIIEDTRLHKNLPVIIWLMAACSSRNKFILGDCHVNWLLGLVKTISKIKFSDQINFKKECISPSLNDYDNLDSKKEKCILYSIKLRKSYGGMHSDMELLTNCEYHWYNKFLLNDNSYCKSSIKIINHTTINPLSKEDWELAAIDFHCMPDMLTLLHMKFKKYNIETLKNTIWFQSSSINNRVPKTNMYQDTWKDIKKFVQKYQYYTINNF